MLKAYSFWPSFKEKTITFISYSKYPCCLGERSASNINTIILKSIVGLVVLTALACSPGNLSKTKAKKIIAECLESNPEQKSTSLKLGEVLMPLTNDISKMNKGKYEKLASQGYITFTKTEKRNPIWKDARYYTIKLTKKAEPYIYKPSRTNKESVSLKTHLYIIDEILEIHEMPVTNTAKVKAKLSLTDITPFMTLRVNNPKESIVKTFKLKKTSDGWVYCRNY